MILQWMAAAPIAFLSLGNEKMCLQSAHHTLQYSHCSANAGEMQDRYRTNVLECTDGRGYKQPV